jgi:hypothetical protein
VTAAVRAAGTVLLAAAFVALAVPAAAVAAVDRALRRRRAAR